MSATKKNGGANEGMGGSAPQPAGSGASGEGGKDTGTGGTAGNGASGGGAGTNGSDGDSSNGDGVRYAILLGPASDAPARATSHVVARATLHASRE
jgi:hypothetical protein